MYISRARKREDLFSTPLPLFFFPRIVTLHSRPCADSAFAVRYKSAQWSDDMRDVFLPFARLGFRPFSRNLPTPKHVFWDRLRRKPQSDLGKKNFSYVTLIPRRRPLFLPIVFSVYNTRQRERRKKKRGRTSWRSLPRQVPRLLLPSFL